ncbi:hypothetical protein Sjap_003583 [Stephania japonica]|uniref:TF-B3 domain-containing protein n=1 Tax=Stephania japonica TaxID=461633 RepID=A0AAP0KP33_9MAGN
MAAWDRWNALMAVIDIEWERINKNNPKSSSIDHEEVKNNININIKKVGNTNSLKNNKIVIKINKDNNNNTIPITNKKIVKKKNKKIVIKKDPEVAREPIMPEQMRQEIERMAGEMNKPIWLVNKRITNSDVSPHLRRLFIPSECESKLEGFLSAEEMKRTRVHGKDQNSEEEEKMVVKIVDGNGGLSDLDFKYWTSVDMYVFTSQWTRFVQRFHVKEGWIVQIWCFRDRDTHLCFGINFHPSLNRL